MPTKKQLEELEVKDLSGLSAAENPKQEEYNLVDALLSAASFQTDDSMLKVIEIKRNGVFLFSFTVHPLSENEVAVARKKATTYMPNPNNRKLPKIQKDFSMPLFNSWIIYLATVEEDKKRIWGQKAVKEKFDLIEDVESIDKLLMSGEKSRIADIVSEISGIDDDSGVTIEDYVKN